MAKSYKANVKNFNGVDSTRYLSLYGAVCLLNSNEADAIILDIVSPENTELWWNDYGFLSSPFTKNQHHAGIVATSVTLGQLQRESDENLVLKSAEYFGVASDVNECLQKTRFVNIFAVELDAMPLTTGYGYNVEFLSATRRVYEPYEAPFNFAPHCDDLSYGRDKHNWPFKKSFERQLGAFLTIESSENDAGMVMWQYRPESREELDEINSEYREMGKISAIDNVSIMSLKPQPGQLTIFQSKNLHAIEKCDSRRRTMGLFLMGIRNIWLISDYDLTVPTHRLTGFSG